MSHRRGVIQALAAFSAGVILAITLFSVAGSVPAQAQTLQDPNEVPINCPGQHNPTGWFQGIWFVSVPMTRINSAPGNTAYYDVEGEPISKNRKWRWVNGGGNFICNRYEGPFGLYFDTITLVGSSDGVMVPTGNEEEAAPHDGSTGGGDVSAELYPGGWCYYWRVRDIYGNLISLTLMFCEG